MFNAGAEAETQGDHVGHGLLQGSQGQSSIMLYSRNESLAAERFLKKKEPSLRERLMLDSAMKPRFEQDQKKRSVSVSQGAEPHFRKAVDNWQIVGDTSKFKHYGLEQ